MTQVEEREREHEEPRGKDVLVRGDHSENSESAQSWNKKVYEIEQTA